MVINIFKKGHDTLTSGVETYIVEWTCRYGHYSSDTKKRFQAFIDKQEAEDFADNIRRAHALIGNTCETEVRVYKNENVGLKV